MAANTRELSRGSPSVVREQIAGQHEGKSMLGNIGNNASRCVLKWINYKLSEAGKHVFRDSNPRLWSNRELRKICPLFKGAAVNVSGWKDEDKEGGFYRDYFSGCSEYSITNYDGARGLGDGHLQSLRLDLEQPLSKQMEGAYDVVLAHTVMEHVADTKTAFDNLLGLSRDIVIVIVPFMQGEHFDEGSYGDYWRFTPMGLRSIFSRAGLDTVYLSTNDNPFFPIYIMIIGSRHSSRWHELSSLQANMAHRIGWWGR